MHLISGAFTMQIPLKGSSPSSPEQWCVSIHKGIAKICHGAGRKHPQYAALHLKSGYFRLIPDLNPDKAGWGTSVILLPSFWAGGRYRQGAPLDAKWRLDHVDLVFTFASEVFGLRVTGEVRLAPPAQGRSTAVVSVNTDGNVAFDQDRPDEGFRPVALSSMKVSETEWDARQAYVGFQSYELPDQDWICRGKPGRTFGLVGGSSRWKRNAPSIEIALEDTLPVSGWVTRSDNPNDDNVLLWAAPEQPIRSWTYRITSKV